MRKSCHLFFAEPPDPTTPPIYINKYFPPSQSSATTVECASYIVSLNRFSQSRPVAGGNKKAPRKALDYLVAGGEGGRHRNIRQVTNNTLKHRNTKGFSPPSIYRIRRHLL